ncbi:MAG: Uma2 family endonuclease [Leptolyngbyaceae bacterium]|nr:Uma2 family endonuclease [Leptolyngbyaceae bacterium]
MIAEPTFNYMSPQDYLDWEATQELKHEYIDGEVFAMTGGTIPHNLIALNLASTLRAFLRGKGCRVFIADVKVQLSERGPYHYPDVMVSCDERDRTAMKLIQYPCLIVEVLSPSTEAYDSPLETLRERGAKFRRYQQLSTLQEYVLVDATQMSVDRFSRLSDRKWELQTYSEGEVLEFTSIHWQGAIDLLYEDVVFEPSPSDQGSAN